MELRIAGIVRESIVDGPGVRFTVFTQGCPHHCPGCHNPATHSYEGGSMVSVDRIIEEFTKNPSLSGMTISGGEPMEQIPAVLELAGRVKELGKDIVIFTGYTFEQLLDRCTREPQITELLALTDILIDGPFLLEERDLSLPMAGSRNQRVLNAKASIERGCAVLYEFSYAV